jgi:hypothetical protein
MASANTSGILAPKRNKPRNLMRLNEGKQNQLNFREMKKTAVEWLRDLYENQPPYDEFILDEQWEKALEMEKEQMVDFAFKYGDLTTREIADSFDKEYKTNEK